ncbi:hypothetical protein B0H13DRAFT_2244748 [Mycena leptocephala]|nr:hypothetical protein B0H13DRAFT_2244748 [Mycena leptocephala]
MTRPRSHKIRWPPLSGSKFPSAVTAHQPHTKFAKSRWGKEMVRGPKLNVAPAKTERAIEHYGIEDASGASGFTCTRCKTTAYDFYAVLERLTDNTGVKPPNRYQIFLRMARQYRHLLMLKRTGRGHDPSGVLGTSAGELAIECPICPNPQVSLPDRWENARPENQFIYVLFLALDACFRLKRCMVSSEIKDPGLGTGWAYMSTCSGLAALDYANTKFSRGYSTTGVGMGVCARHEFVQANRVGDLQRGEGFANMDYIFGSILRHKDPRLPKPISYDIVCQWWKYLLERMKNLPPLVRISIIVALFRFVIPKMHIHSHTLDCQVKFSLNLVPGSGQTDGEGIERPWASIGAIATSTRVSGPGARHDALDDHWNFWNWLKTIGLREYGVSGLTIQS